MIKEVELYLEENDISHIVLVDRVTDYNEETILGEWFWCLMCGEVFDVCFDEFKKQIFSCPKETCESRKGWNERLAGEIYNKSLKYNVLKKNDRISWVCSDCDFIWETTVTNRIHYESGCPSCFNPSKGEETIRDFLKENCVEFTQQKTFDGCADKLLLRFDFYLTGHNLCIEYNGRQHYEPIDYFGGDDTFKNTIKKDKIKSNFCKENNIGLLEISYLDFGNIKEILKGIVI